MRNFLINQSVLMTDEFTQVRQQLDGTDYLILNVLSKLVSKAKDTISENEKIYSAIGNQSIQAALPFLDLSAKAINARIDKMVSLGLIQKSTKNQLLNKRYLTLLEKFSKLF